MKTYFPNHRDPILKADLLETIICVKEDHALPNKRFLPVDVTVVDTKITDTTYETLLSLNVSPIGSYYYSWVSCRWKSGTKHVFELSAFEDLGNGYFELVNSFRSPFDNGFEIRSSRLDFVNRKLARSLAASEDFLASKSKCGNPDLSFAVAPCTTVDDVKCAASDFEHDEDCSAEDTEVDNIMQSSLIGSDLSQREAHEGRYKRLGTKNCHVLKTKSLFKCPPPRRKSFSFLTTTKYDVAVHRMHWVRTTSSPALRNLAIAVLSSIGDNGGIYDD
jgi:hypothetical protein